jgi:hypothetical protein
VTIQKILGHNNFVSILLFFGVLYHSFKQLLENIFGKLKVSSALHKVYKEVEFSAFLTEIKCDASVPCDSETAEGSRALLSFFDLENFS